MTKKISKRWKYLWNIWKRNSNRNSMHLEKK